MRVVICCAIIVVFFPGQVRLPDVLERQGLSLNFLSKLAMSLIHEKHFVALVNFRRR